MSGEGDVWVAHLIELFQVHEDDGGLEEVLDKDSRRSPDNQYALMRCTLRWFYGLDDVKEKSFSKPNIPKPIDSEIFFSDHVERDGYNDIQAIEGRAWLFYTPEQLDAFENSPDPAYVPDVDILYVCRCFVDSNASDLPLRRFTSEDLTKLLANPSKDKALYHSIRSTRSRRTSKSSSGRTRKHRRPIQSSDDDEDDNKDVDYKAPVLDPPDEPLPPPSPVASAGSSSSSSSVRAAHTRTGRRIVSFNSDEEGDGSDYNGDDQNETVDKRPRAKSGRSAPPSRRRASATKSGKVSKNPKSMKGSNKTPTKTERRKSRQRVQPRASPRTSKSPPPSPPPPPPTASPEHRKGLNEETNDVLDYIMNDLNQALDDPPPAPKPSPMETGGRRQSGSSARVSRKPEESYLKRMKKSPKTKKPETIVIDDSDESDAIHQIGASAGPSPASPPPIEDGANGGASSRVGSMGGSRAGIVRNSRTRASTEKPAAIQTERKSVVAARAAARNALARNQKSPQDRREGSRRRSDGVTAGRRDWVSRKDTVDGTGVNGDTRWKLSNVDMDSLMDELTRRFSKMGVDSRQLLLQSVPKIWNELMATMDEKDKHEQCMERMADDFVRHLKHGSAREGVANGHGTKAVTGEARLVESRS